MTENKNVEILYHYLDETAHYLEKNWTVTYLEGLAEAGENLFQKKVCQPLEDSQKERLYTSLESVNLDDFTSEEIRKAYQLAILKGMRGAVQPHHSMTPDAVSLFISYLINKVIGHKKEVVRILDLAVGSGNLISALMNQVRVPIHARGLEVDETLLKLAYVNANLQKHELELFHQDSIEPLPFEQVDVIVTDLPIGYYPKDDIASSYQLKADTGHSYIHHLMIEQGIEKTKEGGFPFFVVPNSIFETEQAKQLHAYIKEQCVILGLLQLPNSMFQSEQFGKSIFMLQKKGRAVSHPKQALLAELPSFSNKEALADMIRQINLWFKNELGI